MRRRIKATWVVSAAGLILLAAWNCIPASVHYEVRETYSFPTDADAGIRLAFMIPTTGPYQEVKSVRISWDGTESRESENSVEVVKLAGEIKAGREKVATIAYDVILRQGKARWQGPVEDFQLQPQPGMESDAPTIVKQAA